MSFFKEKTTWAGLAALVATAGSIATGGTVDPETITMGLSALGLLGAADRTS